MIAVEVLVGILIVTVIIVGIVKIGAPLADAFADRLKLKFQELGPEEERQLKARLAALEEDVRNLKSQVSGLQDSADFATKMEQTGQHELGGKIEMPDRKKV
jgi:cell division protein FtsB